MSDPLWILTPLLEITRAMKFGKLTVMLSIRQGVIHGVEIVEERRQWTLQDVPKKEVLTD